MKLPRLKSRGPFFWVCVLSLLNWPLARWAFGRLDVKPQRNLEAASGSEAQPRFAVSNGNGSPVEHLSEAKTSEASLQSSVRGPSRLLGNVRVFPFPDFGGDTNSPPYSLVRGRRGPMLVLGSSPVVYFVGETTPLGVFRGGTSRSCVFEDFDGFVIYERVF